MKIEHVLNLLEAVSRRDWDDIEKVGKDISDHEMKIGHPKNALLISNAVNIAVSKYGFDDVLTP